MVMIPRLLIALKTCTGCSEKEEIRQSPAELLEEMCCDNCERTDYTQPGDLVWHLKECDLYFCGRCMEC